MYYCYVCMAAPEALLINKNMIILMKSAVMIEQNATKSYQYILLPCNHWNVPMCGASRLQISMWTVQKGCLLSAWLDYICLANNDSLVRKVLILARKLRNIAFTMWGSWRVRKEDKKAREKYTTQHDKKHNWSYLDSVASCNSAKQHLVRKRRGFRVTRGCRVRETSGNQELGG